MHNPITPEWAQTMGNPRLAETYVNVFGALAAGNASSEERAALESSLAVIIGMILQRFVCMYCDHADAPVPGFEQK